MSCSPWFGKCRFLAAEATRNDIVHTDEQGGSFVLRVICRAHKMQRNVWFVANDPAVVPGSDVEKIAGFHFDDAAVIHRGGSAARDNHADVLHRTAFQTLRGSHVDRPFPARFIAGTADGHSSDMNQFEFTFFKGADLIGMIESLEDDVVHESLLEPDFETSGKGFDFET